MVVFLYSELPKLRYLHGCSSSFAVMVGSGLIINFGHIVREISHSIKIMKDE